MATRVDDAGGEGRTCRAEGSQVEATRSSCGRRRVCSCTVVELYETVAVAVYALSEGVQMSRRDQRVDARQRRPAQGRSGVQGAVVE